MRKKKSYPTDRIFQLKQYSLVACHWTQETTTKQTSQSVDQCFLIIKHKRRKILSESLWYNCQNINLGHFTTIKEEINIVTRQKNLPSCFNIWSFWTKSCLQRFKKNYIKLIWCSMLVLCSTKMFSSSLISQSSVSASPFKHQQHQSQMSTALH